jgi:enoyl-[acyl-carrier-protein] reductase (NADH)
VLGVANGNSIAYGAALAFYRAGAELARKNPRWEKRRAHCGLESS